MYAVELRFVIGDFSCAPPAVAVIERLLRNSHGTHSHVEHVRVHRRQDSFHAVLFVTAASAHEAEVVCGVIGAAVATAEPAVRFTGIRPWPGAGRAPARSRQEEAL